MIFKKKIEKSLLILFSFHTPSDSAVFPSDKKINSFIVRTILGESVSADSDTAQLSSEAGRPLDALLNVLDVSSYLMF